LKPSFIQCLEIRRSVRRLKDSTAQGRILILNLSKMGHSRGLAAAPLCASFDKLRMRAVAGWVRALRAEARYCEPDAVPRADRKSATSASTIFSCSAAEVGSSLTSSLDVK